MIDIHKNFLKNFLNYYLYIFIIFYNFFRQMLYLLKTQTTLDRDTVLEGVPTQDMLVLMEMEQNSMEENDLITSLSTQQTFYHLKNLMIIVERFKAFSLDLLAALIWQIIIGEQVNLYLFF